VTVGVFTAKGGETIEISSKQVTAGNLYGKEGDYSVIWSEEATVGSKSPHAIEGR